MASLLKCESRSSSTVVKVAHRWIIENISLHFCYSSYYIVPESKEHFTLESAKFSPFPNSFEMTIVMKLQTNQVLGGKWGRDTLSENISFVLGLISSKYEYLPIKVKLFCLDKLDQKHSISESVVSDSYFKIVTSLKREDLRKPDCPFLSDDNLIIICEISFITDTFTVAGPLIDLKQMGKTARQFALESYASMLGSGDGDGGKHSGVIIRVDDGGDGDGQIREFTAHKCILAQRSTVFAAMFAHKLEETEQNRVNIADVKGDVFELMLRYIYSGDIQHLHKYAMEVMEAADKYDLQELKQFCEHFLCLKLSNDCAIDLLVLADMHNADKLKTSALEYIKRNVNSICKTDKWRIMSENQPNLFEEMHKSLCQFVTNG